MLTGNVERTFVPCMNKEHGNCVGQKVDHGLQERCDCFCHKNEAIARESSAIGEYLESL